MRGKAMANTSDKKNGRGVAGGELQKLVELYRLLEQNIAEVIWILNLEDMRFEYVTPSVEKATGFKSEEIIGSSVDRILTADSLERVYEELRWELERDGEPGVDPDRSRTVLVQQLRKDGSVFDVELTASFMRDESGRPVKILGVSRDVTERLQMEKELREREKKYRAIFETSQAGFFQVALDGTIMEVNPATVRILGWEKREQLVGKKTTEIVWSSPQERQRMFDALEDSGKLLGMEVKLRKADGTIFPVLLSIQWLLDDEGRRVGTEGTIVDITALKRAEEQLRNSHARLESILRAAPVGIGVVVDRVFREVNDRFCQMVGYPRETLIGQNARMIYPSLEDYERVGKEKYDEIRRKGIGTIETRFRRQDGRIIDVLLSSAPIDRTDLSKGVTFTAMDITGMKKARVATERALEEERQASRAKSEFLANISHELRTPMNGILGMLRLLLEEDLSERQRELVEGTIESATELHRILEDMIELSMLEAGRVSADLQEFAPRPLLEQLGKRYSKAASERGAGFELIEGSDIPEVLLGDQLILKKVLDRLFESAVRYAPGGRVKLIVEPELEDEECCVVRFAINEKELLIPPGRI
ncbi:MAG: PAS domain S-box protein, partial [Deltaproteobacteria bacterium]